MRRAPLILRTCLLTGCLLAAPPARGQTHVELSYPVASGSVSNTGSEPAVVLSFPVVVEGAPWMRLVFSDVQLSGDHRDGTGSLLRVTSLLDGEVQELNSLHVSQWRRTTGYFNGDSLLVEVLAAPGTGANSVQLERVYVGEISSEDSQCGTSDDRVPSADPRSCRLVFPNKYCTAFLIDDCSTCLLTARSCFFGGGGIPVAEFNVPPSTPAGTVVHPSMFHQYPLDNNSQQWGDGATIDGQWGYFGIFPNSLTGRTPFQAQSARYVLADPPPFSAGAGIRISGYGFDSSPPQNSYVQQTHVGDWVGLAGGLLTYTVDTQQASEGSAVVHELSGDAIGIHVGDGCNGNGTGANTGMALTSASLQAALANPTGVCNDYNCGRVGQGYCTSNGATISASGSAGLSAMDLLLSARGLPPKTPALFIYAQTQQAVPFGQGTKCVGPSQTFRVKPALISTIAGSIDTVLNYANLPAAGRIQVGDTWNFQAWFRDGSGAFDLTDAVQITFIP